MFASYSTRNVMMCPAVEQSYLNRALINPYDDLMKFKHVEIVNDRNQRFVFTLEPCYEIKHGFVAFNFLMRRQSLISHNRRISIKPYRFDLHNDSIGKMVLSVDFMHEIDRQMISEVTKLNVNELASEFAVQFPMQSFTVGQIIAFRFQGNKTLKLVVREIEEMFSYRSLPIGITVPNSKIIFQRSPDASLQLLKTLNSTVNFDSSNIRDYNSKQRFIAMSKQALTAGKFPREVIQGSRIENIHGALFYGPPGSGKRSMAIQFGKMLNATETELLDCSTIVDLLDRKGAQLFGSNINGLRVVVLDEIDAIFRDGNSTRVARFYQHLDDLRLSKSLLIIGITSRVDQIPRELLAAGRLEIQVEITLPQIHGRIELLHLTQGRLEVLKLVDNCGGEMDTGEWQCLVSCFVLNTLSTWFLPVVSASVRNNKSFYRLYSAIETSNRAW